MRCLFGVQSNKYGTGNTMTSVIVAMEYIDVDVFYFFRMQEVLSPGQG